MENMSVFDYNGAIPEGDWTVSRLYAVMVFEKTAQEVVSEPDYPYDKYRFFYPSSPEPYRCDTESKQMILPTSPDHPPDIVPTSPDFPPEDDNEDEEEDTALMLLLQRRAKAISLAGGQDAWDALSEEQMDVYLAKAADLKNSTEIVPSSPDFPPPESAIVPTSPEFPPEPSESYFGDGYKPTSPDFPPPDNF